MTPPPPEVTSTADPTVKIRMKAAKLCVASFVAGLFGLGCLLVVPPLAPAPGLVALVTGTLGLLGLARVGLGSRRRDAAPLERVASKMARRTRPQAWIGFTLGLASIVWPLVHFLHAV